MVGRISTESTAPVSSNRVERLTAVDVLPILIVDDRVENLRALEPVLEPLGYPLLTATSGAEALRLVLEHDFALILLDVRMPELSGLDTARMIKGRARTREIPILFMTASPDEVDDIIRGYGLGALDYLLKPIDPELLRSKVAVFAELEMSRRALQRSEALLRGAFEAAPIGKTVLDAAGRIVRANPAFARMLRREPEELVGIAVGDLAQAEDRDQLLGLLAHVAEADGAGERGAHEPYSVDITLRTAWGSDVLVEAVASAIEPSTYAEPLLMIQWVDLSARHRAEQARAELMLEQAARAQAERTAQRLQTLQELSDAIDALSLEELLGELALRLAELFGVEVAELHITEEVESPLIVRAAGGHVVELEPDEPPPAGVAWLEMQLTIERASMGMARLGVPRDRSFTASDRSLLSEVVERAALSIRRTQLREQEHRIAEELQRGLLPKRLPELPGIELAAHYEAAGLGAEAGGDWYDAFALSGHRIGVVVGDVTGRGVRAASTMGQMRSVTRAFALADDGSRSPGEVLTRVNRYQLALAEDELFTLVYAIVDPRAGSLVFANGGHPPPLLRAGGDVRFLEGGGGLMGLADAAYEDVTAAIGPHDRLLLYSDGLVERRGESLDVGLQRLAEAVASGPDEPERMLRHLLRQVLPPDAGLHDDVTAMLVGLRG